MCEANCNSSLQCNSTPAGVEERELFAQNTQNESNLERDSLSSATLVTSSTTSNTSNSIEDKSSKEQSSQSAISNDANESVNLDCAVKDSEDLKQPETPSKKAKNGSKKSKKASNKAKKSSKKGKKASNKAKKSSKKPQKGSKKSQKDLTNGKGKEPLTRPLEQCQYHTMTIRSKYIDCDDVNAQWLQMLYDVNKFYNRARELISNIFCTLLRSPDYKKARKEGMKTGDWSKCFELEKQAGLWQTPTKEILIAITQKWSLDKATKESANFAKVDLGLIDSICARSIFARAWLAAQRKELWSVRYGHMPCKAKIKFRNKFASNGMVYWGQSNKKGFHVGFDVVDGFSDEKVPFLFVPKLYAEPFFACEGVYKGSKGTARIPLINIAPKIDDKGKNIAWLEFYESPEAFVSKVAVVGIYTFVDGKGRQRVNINLICKGAPSPTEGRYKGLRANSFDPFSPESMDLYTKTKVGADQSPKSICAYSSNGVLRHIGYTNGPKSLCDKITSLQQQLSKLERENNPDKLDEKGCFIRKSEWTSSWVNTPETWRLKSQIKKLQQRRTFFRKIDHRRIASLIVGMGGDIRMEYMAWLRYIRHKKKGGQKASKGSASANQSSTSSASNSVDSSITAQEVVIREKESVAGVHRNNGAELDKHAINNQTLVVKSEVTDLSISHEKGGKSNLLSEKTSTDVMSPATTQDGSAKSTNSEKGGVEETKETSKQSDKPINRRGGPYLNGSVQKFAPGEEQQDIFSCALSFVICVFTIVSCFAGASKTKFAESLQKELDSLYKFSLANNFGPVVIGNDIYMVQRDAWAAFNLCYIDITTGKFDDQVRIREFEKFWRAHEKLRAEFESYEESSATVNKSKESKHCDYMRRDITVPTKAVLRKWRLTKSDREALDRIREIFGDRQLVKFHGIGF